MNQDIVHISVRIGVADNFLLVVYSYRIKMIPNTWTFNIIIFFVLSVLLRFVASDYPLGVHKSTVVCTSSNSIYFRNLCYFQLMACKWYISIVTHWKNELWWNMLKHAVLHLSLSIKIQIYKNWVMGRF